LVLQYYCINILKSNIQGEYQTIGLKSRHAGR
jgi:hypothetical protein